MEAFYDVRDFRSVRELIDSADELFGDRTAFEIKKGDLRSQITYHQYRDDVNALSTALIHQNIEGVCVAVCGDNCYEYCMTYISVICSGGIIVPVDKELHEEDIRGILDASSAKYLFCDKKVFSRLSEETLADLTVYCFNPKKEEVTPFTSLLEEGNALIAEGKELWKTVEQKTDKLCTLIFTSGTTGVSKGVMLCQNNYIFEVKACMGVLKIYPEDCAISLLPLHHTFESAIILFFAPYCGAKITFCESFKYVMRNMKEFNPSLLVAVPLVLETVHKRIMKEIKKTRLGPLKLKTGKALCRAAKSLNFDLSKIIFKEVQAVFGGKMRLIICGGASIDPQILEDFEAWGIHILFGYGLTECAPLAIINHDRLQTTDSIGVPLPGVDVKIEDPDNDGIGEVCVRGGMVMLGYYNNPQATAEVMDDEGFFHTGDLGFVDNEGHYHLTGRCKNVIVTSNGKNIYPEELEYHLNTNEIICSCMVEGVEDKKGETHVHAQIFPDLAEIKEALGKAPSPEEIHEMVKQAVDAANEHLPAFKHIRSFTVRETDFIKTTTHKIKRDSNKTAKSKSH